MNVFELRRQLLSDYAEYVRSVIEIRDPRVRDHVNRDLDAGFLGLYLGTPDEWYANCAHDLLEAFASPRDAVTHVREMFLIVLRHNEAAHGEYRTKRVILELDDEVSRTIETGHPFQTQLDPPPADPIAAHSPR